MIFLLPCFKRRDVSGRVNYVCNRVVGCIFMHFMRRPYYYALPSRMQKYLIKLMGNKVEAGFSLFLYLFIMG